MKTDKAFVNKQILKWARVTANIPIEIAAKRASVKTKQLQAWEDSTLYPTISQAKKLAKAYRRPFALLFLDEIPKDFQPLQDYRKKGSKALGTASIFIIREIQQKQNWMSEWLQDNNQSPLPFVGSCSLKDSPKEVANKIRSIFSLSTFPKKKKPLLRNFIQALEDKGLFVSRSSNYYPALSLDPDEFLGFSIADPYAPFIFINTNNHWERQQIFTLFHELAHVFIHESSISNHIEQIPFDRSDFNNIEKFCNSVAVNVLLTEEDILLLSSDQYQDTVSLFNTAISFGTSSNAFLARLRDLGLIHQKTYRKMLSELKEGFESYQKKSTTKKSDKINPYPPRINRNSRNFSIIVYDAYTDGLISASTASSLLQIKVNHFDKFSTSL
jgi:Zn-dependent peptidase ImmA (M78 family)